MRRKLIWAATFLPAAYFLLLFCAEGVPALGKGGLNLAASEIYVSRGVVVVLAMAVGLGVINLFSLHAANIYYRRKEWAVSIVVCGSFAAVTVAMLWQYRLNGQRQAMTAAAAESSTSAARQLQDFEDRYHFEPRAFYVNSVYTPLMSTVMALLGFYITYAAYRAFRLRSVEAAVMMLSAAVVILGSDPIGGWLTAGRMTAWADFDNRVLNSGMQRGLLLGIGVAVIAASLRIMFGFDRGIGDTQEGEG